MPWWAAEALVVRYLRIWMLFIKTALIREMEFRGNFFSWMVINLLWMAFTLVFFWVLYGHTDSIAGWGVSELLTLLGVYYLFEYFVWTFGYPNLGRISRYINTGELDFFLLKPINSQFHVSLRRMSPHNSASLIPAAALLVTGLRGLGVSPDPVSLLTFAVLFAAGVLIFYALWFMSVTAVFWMQRGQNIQELFLVTLQAMRVPSEVFGLLGQFVLTFVVPVAMVTMFPTRALMGTLRPELAVAMVGVALGLLWVSGWWWRFALRRYDGASA